MSCTIHGVYLCSETLSYLETALWSSHDYDGESECMDADYSFEDFAPEALRQAARTVLEFETLSDGLILESDTAHLGHDLWLTQNHHGAGFWDGDYSDGDTLTELAHRFAETDCYAGDDGRVYFS